MIIGTFVKHEVGEVVADGLLVEHSGGVGVRLPYQVLREATEREWIDEQIADGCWDAAAQLRFRLSPRAFHYYDVSVD